MKLRAINVGLLIAVLWLSANADRTSLYSNFSGENTLNGTKVALRLPFATTGGGFMIDNNAVTNVTFTDSSGTATLGDSLSKITWTANSTVSSQTSGAIWYPTGFANAAAIGAGKNWSTTRNWSTPNGKSLDFTTSGFMSCIAFWVGDATSNQVVFSDLDAAVDAGWYWQINTGKVIMVLQNGASAATDSGVAISSNAFHVACGGYDGTEAIERVDGGANSVGSAFTFKASGSDKAYLGQYNTGTAFAGILYSFYATSTKPTAALMLNENLAYWGNVGSFGEQLTMTRASVATDTLPTGGGTSCATPPCLFTWPAGVVRISTNGALIEDASTNVSIQSEALDNAAWTATNTTVTANTTVAPDNQTTAETVHSTMNGGLIEGTGASAAAALYTASIWAKTGSGTQSFDLRIHDITGASDYKACNGLSATTTWTRFTCAGTANATASDSIAIDLYPGGSGGQGTIRAWGAQLEKLDFASSYISTAGTSVTRNSDQLSFTPTGANNFSKADYSLSFDAKAEAISSDTNRSQIAIRGPSFTPYFRLTSSGASTCDFFSDNGSADATLSSPGAVTTFRHYQASKLGAAINCKQGATACTAGTVGTQVADPTSIQIGATGTSSLYGWIGNICWARSYTGCSICTTTGCKDP